MKKLKLYLQNYISHILLQLMLILLGAGLFLLERYRHADLIDLNIMFYYILLSIVLIVVWHVVRYMKLRPYYESLFSTLEDESELDAIYLLTGEVTREQQLTSELLYEQQKKYRGQLQKMERQKEMQYHFIMQWVHQMKTPLSVIDLQLQQAQHQLKQRLIMTVKEQQELYTSIIEETDKLQNGLELMLGSARLDHIELDLHVKSVELHIIIRDIINRYKKLFIQHSIFPRLYGEATAITDSKWLSFVMNQLISNAIKYCKDKEGNKSLDIHIYEIDQGVNIAVKDEGIGIPQADIKRVFDPFFTGSNGRLTGESTGMGLYLAKEICIRLGHTLTVQSVEGEGTTFILTIKENSLHQFETN